MLPLALSLALAAAPATGSGDCLDDLERLGRHLFFDEDLSEPAGQSCASCHGPRVGFTGPSSPVNEQTGVYPGAVPTRYGNRKPPAAAYATDAPPFSYDAATGRFTGGNFWDGRATGERLGSPAADQAQGPFLNPLEQNNPDAGTVVAKVCASAYAGLFLKVWGPDACADPVLAYDRIALSIAAFEASPEVSPRSSKWDAVQRGLATLDAAEARGEALFLGKARCAECHPAPVFTSFGYENVGLPRSPRNPFYDEPEWNPDGLSWVDPGLAGFLATREEWAELAPANHGKHKIPTLRNVSKRPSAPFVKGYGHNGVFRSEAEVVHFLATRDVLATCETEGGVPGETCWPAPEVAFDVNTVLTGNLGLTAGEEADLLSFLAALGDGYFDACPR